MATQGWTELARDSSELEALKRALTGDFVHSGSDEYEAACKAGWNAVSAKHRPIGFVYCANTNDVVHAMNFARKNHPHVVVRYHDSDARALCDGALVLDLSRMKNCRTWPCDQVGMFEPGLSWDEVNAKTMEHGLAIPGPAGHLGITRTTLAGAGGLLSRQYGLALDNLIEAEVVTTDGSVVFPVSEKENAQLFWALRGAGETVGVVTSMTFKLHQVQSPSVYAGTLTFPVEWGKEILKAREVFSVWLAITDSLPNKAHISAVLTTPPPDKRPCLASRPIHKPAWGSAITAQENSHKYAYAHPSLVFTVFYNGPIDAEGTMIFQPLLQMGPSASTLGVMPYVDAVNLTSWITPRGDRYYYEGAIVDSQAASYDVLEAAVTAVRKSPRLSVVFEERAQGAVEGVDQNSMAFPHREPRMSCTMIAHWTDSEDDTTSQTMVQALHRQLAGAELVTGGSHMMDHVDKVDEISAWGAQHTKRVAELREEYDPAMVLMVNHPN